MPAVETHLLTKRFADFTALDACSITVAGGEVFGLLGPNGAGKTTLLRSLLGFLQPTSGTAKVCGFCTVTESVRVRENVAYLPGDARLPGHMNGHGILRFFADLHPMGSLKRSLEIADELELDLRRRVGFMSTGMRQKLALCVVLSTDAPILILDEPTANLDPTVRAAVLEHVLRAKHAGRTVIFSSHVLSEIQRVCDRVVFLRRGKLVLEQPMEELQDRHRVKFTLENELPEIPEELAAHVRCVRGAQNSVVLDAEGDLAPILSWLSTLHPRELRLEPLGIDAIYDRVHGLAPSENDASPAQPTGETEATS